MSQGKAYYIRRRTMSGHFTTSHQRLYRLDPPMETPEGSEVPVVEYVWVSGAQGLFVRRPETYVFPAGQNGEILSYLELPGSFKGSVDHARALEGLGYAVAKKGEVSHADV